MRDLRRWGVLISAMSVLALGGCSVAGLGDSGGSTLNTNAGNGGDALYVPGHRTHWTASFGQFVLCLSSGRTPVTLRKVAAVTQPSDLRVRTWIRTVTPASRGPNIHTVFGSTLGAPPSFDQPYADGVYGGSWTRKVVGTRISQTCKEQLRERRRFTELVFVFSTGPGGARVKYADLSYESGGHERHTRMSMQMTLCGTDPEWADMCKRP